MSALPTFAASELTTATIARLVGGLPAECRAKLAWAPATLEERFLEPLFAITSQGELESRLTALVAEVSRFSISLGKVLTPLLSDPHVVNAMESTLAVRAEEQFEQVAAFVEPIDDWAADHLRETLALSRSTLPVFLSAVAQAELEELDKIEEDLIDSLEWPHTAPTIMIAFLTATFEWLQKHDGESLHPLFSVWCEIAHNAANETVSLLSEMGIRISSPWIPGFTAREWRQRWAARVYSGFTNDEMRDLDSTLRRRHARRALE